MKNLILFFFLLVFSTSGFSQWSTNPAVNNLVSNVSGNHQLVATCPDGAGGIIMAWEDNSGSSVKIKAQKINVFGQPVWASGGISVCLSGFDQLTPSICTDAAGGAIIYWADFRTGGGSFDFYAQRIRTDGLIMWNSNGIKVNNLSASSLLYQTKCIAAEAGSSIILWGDIGSYKFYTQKLDAFGVRVWDAADVLLSSNWQSYFDLCYDGGKGAFYCWSELTGSAFDLFAQHVNALGNIQWSPRKTVSDEAYFQYYPVMCEDQAGGFIVAWNDLRSFIYTPLTPSWDIYAAHFNSAGDNLWTLNGIPVCTNLKDQYAATCISDLHGGAHIFWIDFRSVGVSGYSIFGQNVDFNGNAHWTFDGKKIADKVDYFVTSEGDFKRQIAGCDALGGAIVCWMGYYDAGLTQYGLLTQKIDYSGNTQWDPNGVFASTGSLKKHPSLIFDGGSGGCNIAWTDARSGNFNIYAQHIKSNSALGNNKPKPVYTGTKDIISQNYPNPFNPTTNIAFTLANDAKVSIAIFDMSGRELQVLVDGFVTAGDHSVTWNASNYASGTYFYKFTNGNNVEVKKMFLVK